MKLTTPDEKTSLEEFEEGHTQICIEFLKWREHMNTFHSKKRIAVIERATGAWQIFPHLNKTQRSIYLQLKQGKKAEDIISVKEDSFPFIYQSVHETFINYLNISPSNEKFRNLDEYTNQFKLLFNPDFLEINYNTLEGIYIQHPDVSTLKYPFQIELQKIMQYYEYLRKI